MCIERKCVVMLELRVYSVHLLDVLHAAEFRIRLFSLINYYYKYVFLLSQALTKLLTSITTVINPIPLGTGLT